MTNVNMLPIVGWLISLMVCTSLSVPFWICWTVCGIGQTYFYWLPAVYLVIPFWNAVGLFMVVSILASIVKSFFPVSFNSK